MHCPVHLPDHQPVRPFQGSKMMLKLLMFSFSNLYDTVLLWGGCHCVIKSCVKLLHIAYSNLKHEWCVWTLKDTWLARLRDQSQICTTAGMERRVKFTLTVHWSGPGSITALQVIEANFGRNGRNWPNKNKKILPFSKEIFDWEAPHLWKVAKPTQSTHHKSWNCAKNRLLVRPFSMSRNFVFFWFSKFSCSTAMHAEHCAAVWLQCSAM